MSVSGGYGVVLQVSEGALQQSLDAFVAANNPLFHFSLQRQIPIDQYSLGVNVNLTMSLQQPQITLKPDRTVALGITIVCAGTTQAALQAIPGGSLPLQPPTLSFQLSGTLAIEVEAVHTTLGGVPCLALDLEQLKVTNFDIKIDQSDIEFPPEALAVLSAIARRSALVVLARQVKTIPISFALDANLPILGPLHIPVVVDYKIVVSGTNRAIAILLQVMNERVDYGSVGYAIVDGSNFAILISLDLINYALGLVCRALEGYQVTPPSSLNILGNFIIFDVGMHAEPGAFVLDHIKVQSSLLQKIVSTVETVICTAIDPCKAFCKKVLNTVIQWVQLDQIAHASGRFSPKVDADNFRVASGIDVDISWPLKLFVFTAADALIPLGGVVSVVLMVVGHSLLDRDITSFVDSESEAGVLDRPIPGTRKRVVAAASKITWPDGAMAIQANIEVEDQ
jgi:hypothetical protein